MKGSYCLCINVSSDIEVSVGALGAIKFPAGSYIYVGSALNSLEPRLRRHMKTSTGQHKVTHWHIDYLLRNPNASLKSIYVKRGDERLECRIADMVAGYGEPVPRFGCSDCKCQSHLYRVDEFSFLGERGMTPISLPGLLNRKY